MGLGVWDQNIQYLTRGRGNKVEYWTGLSHADECMDACLPSQKDMESRFSKKVGEAESFFETTGDADFYQQWLREKYGIRVNRSAMRVKPSYSA